MNMLLYREEVKSMFLNLDGEEIERTPYSYPYNYDEYVIWKSEDFNKDTYHAVYSDRLYQWDYNKFEKCCDEVFKDKGQQFYQREPKEIEKFLSMYFDKEIKLTAVMQGCNQSSGFPYWIFLYETIEQ